MDFVGIYHRRSDNPVNSITSQPLPIEAALPELGAALGVHNAAVLVAPAPAGPAQPVPGVVRGLDDQAGEQARDLVAG